MRASKAQISMVFRMPVYYKSGGGQEFFRKPSRLAVPDEPHNGFNVIGVRKHIDGLDTLGAVTGI